jgi:hypothetical protein
MEVRLKHSLDGRPPFAARVAVTIPEGATIQILNDDYSGTGAESLVQWGRQRLIVSRETLITFELRLGSYA